MRLSLRGHILFVTGLLVSTLGLGLLWSLALALRAGNAGFVSVLTGGLGVVLLTFSVPVTGRYLFVMSRASRSISAREQRKQEVHIETHD